MASVLHNKLIKYSYRLTTLRRDTGWHFGLGHSYFKKAKGARILIYHGICIDDHLRFNTLFIKLKTFETQLRLYKKYFNIVSLDDFYEGRYSKDRFTICLTFDDGFANNHKYVLPLLEQYQVPATFFITGIRDAGYDILWNDVLSMGYKYGPEKLSLKDEEFVREGDRMYISSSTGQRLVDKLRASGFENKIAIMELLYSSAQKAESDHWLQMTKDEIKTLSQSNWVTIGSHSYYHNDLTKMPIALVKEDITRTKYFLENITDKEVKALAFPYGCYTKEIVELAKNTGYSQLLATEFLFPDDVSDTSMRERLTINPFISTINQMHANITGHYK